MKNKNLLSPQQQQEVEDYLQQGEAQKALDILLPLYTPKADKSLVLLLIDAYEKQGNILKAIELLVQYENRLDSDIMYRIGLMLQHQEIYDVALGYYVQLLRREYHAEAWQGACECGIMWPYRKRVKEFWQWMLDNEAQLSEFLAQKDIQSAGELLRQGNYNLGYTIVVELTEDHELIFSTEGEIQNFYLNQYCVEQMPEELEGRWTAKPFKESKKVEHFEMYDLNLLPEDIQVLPTFQAEDNDLSLTYYHKGFLSLSEEQANEMMNNLLDLCLGEGVNYIYTKELKLAKSAPKKSFPLPKLRAYLEAEAKKLGEELHEDPTTLYYDYSGPETYVNELGKDILTGDTNFVELRDEYFANNTMTSDRLKQNGVWAASIVCSHKGIDNPIDFRQELEELDIDLLIPKGLGKVIGGAIGRRFCYCDVLVYDFSDFMPEVQAWLKRYPDMTFYLSEIRADGRTFLLSADESAS